MTGAFLGKSTAVPVPTHSTNTEPHHHPKGQVIDGFIRPGTKIARQSAHQESKKVIQDIAASTKPVTPKKTPTATLHHAGHIHVHTTPKAVRHHQPEHAKTLMRHTVQKPHTQIKPAIKTQVAVELPAKLSRQTIAHKLAATNINISRLERAKATVKHTAIQHFQMNTAVGAPALEQHRIAATPGHPPVIPVRAQPPTAISRPAVQHVQRPDMFETAMRHARSHEQPAHRAHKAHRRLTNTLAVIGVFLVLGGFIAYLNLPGIEVHIASFNAGFRVSMPGYSPTGYTLEGGIQRAGGTVSMHFVSGDSSYTITEQPSNWNSRTLADNTAAIAGTSKPIERNGRLIYVYGGSNAAWVNNNVRYDITSNASITSDQLVNIAASM